MKNNKTKKCGLETCEEFIVEESHGNRDYCSGSIDDPNKCYDAAKKIRQTQQAIEKANLKTRRLELSITLANFNYGSKNTHRLTVDGFKRFLYKYLDLFESRFLKEHTILYFGVYHLTKIQHNNIIYLEIYKK